MMSSRKPRLSFTYEILRGQHPKTREWTMKGEVLELVHGGRSVNVLLEGGDSRLFMREDVRLDSTKKYEEYEEEDLSTQLAGTGLEARMDQELAETRKRPRRARQQASSVQDEPRRSLRLAKKKVTMGEEQDSHNPEHLPYYMDAVEQGHAGM